MEKYIKRKHLTSEQYMMANRTMAVILLICHLVYVGIEIINLSKDDSGNAAFTFMRCGIYLLFAIINLILVKAKGDTKMCMLYMAVEYLITYTILVIANGVVVMMMAFPVLIGFMLYLNSLIVVTGAIYTFLVCVVKCISLVGYGDGELLGYGILITMGFAVAIYGSYRAISILYRFSEMDREVIEQEAERRAAVAQTVSGIVSKLDDDFHMILDNLDGINGAMSTADEAMDEISGSSENTAEAVNNQADMTSNIQERLVSTNDLVVNAKDTTDKLKGVINRGKGLADNLQEQSDVVDQNIIKISETVDGLVENVQKVSGITESILNISSQTNLLALNASIEAARAGEAGKGFAVVADEIRKLAEETKVSTEKITEIINQLTGVTNRTQAGIEESVEAINIQRKCVEDVTASFTEVENDMVGLQTDVDTMSMEVEAVLEANREIVDSISLLSAVSQQVSAGTQTCKETISGAFEDLGAFSSIVKGTFTELQTLKEATEE